ncbi:MAG: WecB/TagA/CpsF family glycosyltransferase [Kiritimatiellae bacterium]|nr:WecB/TagA/CpsF family glycosyltransferase [Kiritimatiellia bacterium]
MVRALAAAGHDLTLVTEPGVAAEFFPGMKALEAPKWTRRAVFSMFWHLFALPRLIRRTGCHAMLILAANRRALWRCPLPTVGVVHDLSQYHVAAKYDAFRMFYIKRVLPHYVRRMHRVVAISKSTAADLVKHWGIPETKISVVYDGFTPPTSIQAANATADIARRSILYISRLEHPGKNHVGLIEAYGKLPRDLAEKHPLVLAGGDWNGSEAVHAAVAQSPYRDFIRLAGFVPTADLPRLWAEAAVYVFPSRFEGFGLSLLEAMAVGVPTACSCTSSLGELGEGVAELFDPEYSDAIAAALVKLLTSDNTARIAAGKARAAEFSWARCAQGLLDAFPKAEVFGVPIHCETMETAVQQIAQARDTAHPHFFSFVNAHCLNLAYSDGDYVEVLKRCDRVWPDGTGVRMAGRRYGFPVPANVNGTDLFPLLSGRVFLYGAGPGVAERAAANIKKAHPQMEVVGTADGYGDERAAISTINRVEPDVLLVARGVPLQEKWIAAHLHELRCGAVLAVGGLLDFVSGRIPRAPHWMRCLGIEWLYRLKCEPIRMFRRYVIGNPLFLWRLRQRSGARN